MSRDTSPCVRCDGRVWLSTDTLGRTIEVCASPCGYKGSPRPSGAALKPWAPDQDRKRAHRKIYNQRLEARGIKR